jgi:UDP-N-acetylglucosamine acyltransferase
MSTKIHPTAIVEDGAQLGVNVDVGAFCFVGKDAKLGDNTRLHHHASVEGDVCLGTDNEIFPYALVGGTPKLKIGNENIFREYVTAHVATNDGEFTTIGSQNVFLAYSHVAHDCNVGNHVIMSSHSALGGHAIVEDHVNIGWGAGVHQFCQLGRYAMLSACSKLVQDVPPYMLADGSPAEVRSINKVAMDRADISSEKVELVKSLFKILYKSDLNRSQALEQIKQQNEEENSEITTEILNFVSSSNRGIA